MSNTIKSGSSSDLANVNSDKELSVALTKTIDKSGFSAIASNNNPDGNIAEFIAPETSQNNRLKSGRDIVVLGETVNYTGQNTANWICNFTTMTVTVGGGSFLFNANNTNNASTGVQLTHKRYFPIIPTAPLVAEFIVSNVNNNFLTNEEVILGFFPPAAATSVPVDGVYLRLTSAGISLVLNYNGVEFANVLSGQLTTGEFSKLAIKFGQREVTAWINGVKMGAVEIPAANATPCLSGSLPVGIQYRNTGAVTGIAMQFKVSNVNVIVSDVDVNIPVGVLCTSIGQIISQGQNNGAMGTTALYSNNLAAGAGAAMTNTTAALGTGLGGQFTAQPTLAAGTDGIICSYQNPAATVNTTGRIKMITGIRVQGAVTSALTGGAVLYAYSLAYGHTALAMTTAESGSFVNNTAKAPRRIALGFESFAANAPLATIGQGVFMPFASPIPVYPGEFIAVCAKNLGVVTSAGTITFLVTFDGYDL